MIDKNLEIASWHCETENCNNCPLWGKDDCYKIVEDYNNKANKKTVTNKNGDLILWQL